MKFAEKAIDSRASDTINRGIDLVWWSLKTKKNKKKRNRRRSPSADDTTAFLESGRRILLGYLWRWYRVQVPRDEFLAGKAEQRPCGPGQRRDVDWRRVSVGDTVQRNTVTADADAAARVDAAGASSNRRPTFVGVVALSLYFLHGPHWNACVRPGYVLTSHKLGKEKFWEIRSSSVTPSSVGFRLLVLC